MKTYAIRIEEIQEDGRRTQCLPFVKLADGCELQASGFCLIGMGIDTERSLCNVMARDISRLALAHVFTSNDDLTNAALLAVKIAKKQGFKGVF